jgi:hypothetical protein
MLVGGPPQLSDSIFRRRGKMNIDGTRNPLALMAQQTVIFRLRSKPLAIRAYFQPL